VEGESAVKVTRLTITVLDGAIEFTATRPLSAEEAIAFIERAAGLDEVAE